MTRTDDLPLDPSRAAAGPADDWLDAALAAAGR
jgi:hypothetical protein